MLTQFGGGGEACAVIRARLSPHVNLGEIAVPGDLLPEQARQLIARAGERGDVDTGSPIGGRPPLCYYRSTSGFAHGLVSMVPKVNLLDVSTEPSDAELEALMLDFRRVAAKRRDAAHAALFLGIAQLIDEAAKEVTETGNRLNCQHGS